MHEQSQHLTTDHLEGNLGRRALRGGAIVFAGQGLKLAAQMASVVVLARLLPPGAFGLIAMVAALGTVLDLVKELGLSTATIQCPRLTQAQVSALFWVNVGAGVVIALALVGLAPAIAVFYRQPELVTVTRWLALGFVMSGLTTQHLALLRRQMRFAAVATVDTFAELSGLAVAVVLALAGVGFWALLAQRLTPVAINLAGSWTMCRWRPDRPRRAPIGALLRFGFSVTGSNVVTALARSVDQILIGWLLGPVVLGLYERAAKLLLVPINNINIPLYSVALPTLSRLTDDEARYRRSVLRLFEVLAMATMPGAALIAATSDWATNILFGPAWNGAIPLVACFAAAAITQPTIIAGGILYLPENRGPELLRSTLIDATLCILFFVIGLRFGAVGVAFCFAAGSLAIRLPISLWLVTRHGPTKLHDLISAILPSLTAAISVAATIAVLRRMVPMFSSVTPLVCYLAIVPVAIAVAAATIVLFPRGREALAMVARLPRTAIGRPAAEVQK